MDVSAFTTQILTLLGAIGTIAFLLVGLGDFVVAAIDVIANHLSSKAAKADAEKIDFWWAAFKEIYQDYRNFLDKMSIYSRPR